VLTQVAECLSYIHDAGLVHRDIKPGNVMWLPRINRWTLIDFGCAARTGEPAPVNFTLAYGAPETVRAFVGKAGAVTADPAVDVWALGVMAWELLTGTMAFTMYRGKEEVRVLDKSDHLCS
jgi:eukaryotic-like serine/threonine-protein kinase